MVHHNNLLLVLQDGYFHTTYILLLLSTFSTSICKHFIWHIIFCICSGSNLVDGRLRYCTLLQYCSISTSIENSLLLGKDSTLIPYVGYFSQWLIFMNRLQADNSHLNFHELLSLFQLLIIHFTWDIAVHELIFYESRSFREIHENKVSWIKPRVRYVVHTPSAALGLYYTIHFFSTVCVGGCVHTNPYISQV